VAEFKVPGHQADGDTAMTRRKGEISRGDLKRKYSQKKKRWGQGNVAAATLPVSTDRFEAPKTGYFCVGLYQEA
jgi:hypothetical protein